MPITQKQTQEQGQQAGLCDTCSHSRRITSARESVFMLCQLGFSDAQYPKYPRLPVLSCTGYSATATQRSPDCSDNS
jgi:hypothetical protein